MAAYQGQVLFEQPSAAPAGAAAPNIVPIANGVNTTTAYDVEGKAGKEKLLSEAEQHRVQSATTSPFDWQGVLSSPAALVTGGAVLGYLTNQFAIPAIKKGASSIKNRWLSNGNTNTATIDIPVDNGAVTSQIDISTSPAQVSPQMSQQESDWIASSEKAKADKIRYAQEREAIRQSRFGAPPVETPPDGMPNATPDVGVNPSSALEQPPANAPAPQQTLTQAVETGGDVGTALKADVAKMVDEAAGVAPVAPPQELLTGTGKPAYAGQGPAAEIRAKGKKAGEPMLRNNYAKIEDVPAGYAFVPGAQHIDTSRTNIGQTEYTKAYTGRPFPASNELAVQESNDINRLLGRPTRAEAKAAGLTLPPQTPGITKHVLESKGTPFMGTKAAKVGGILGALVAIPDLVNAQTVGQRGMAGANLLESVLPLGAQINEAGAPGVQQSQISQAALLGSPYAQTEWAKTQRLRERAGAGRGIAPPSAYQR